MWEKEGKKKQLALSHTARMPGEPGSEKGLSSSSALPSEGCIYALMLVVNYIFLVDQPHKFILNKKNCLSANTL